MGESIKHLGGTGFIISLVIPKKAKRKEYQAATAKKAEWDHVFLRPSGEDIQALATHLEQGKIKAVVDGVWDLHSQSGNESVSAYGDLHDPKASWQGVFEKLFSGRAKGKCVLKCFSEETTQVPKMDQEKNE